MMQMMGMGPPGGPPTDAEVVVKKEGSNDKQCPKTGESCTEGCTESNCATAEASAKESDTKDEELVPLEKVE